MNGTKRFLVSFIFSSVYIASFIFAGCSLPFGSLQTEPGLGVANNYIKARSKHPLPYYVKDTFNPVDDVEVYGYFGGVEVPIYVKDYVENDQVVIKIIDKSGEVIVCDKKNGYVFPSAGDRSVVVYFGALEALYEIVVKAPETGGNNTGIVIIWLD
jgi:hypothetical protein